MWCHAVQLIEPWWPKQRQNIITALTTLPQGWILARMHDSNHYNVDTIFVGLSWELHWWWHLDRALSNGGNGKTKGLITQPRWVSAQICDPLSENRPLRVLGVNCVIDVVRKPCSCRLCWCLPFYDRTYKFGVIAAEATPSASKLFQEKRWNR